MRSALPLTKGKTTAVGKSPNTVLFSPLSMASSASGRQLGDDTMDSSFELDVVEEHTPPRANLKSISERDFNAPEVVTAANAEEDAEHSWLRRRRDSDPETLNNAGNSVVLSTIPPSADEAMIHRRVAELRLALRTADGALDKARARFEEAEVARNEAESERRHFALGCGRSRERRRFRVLAYTTDLSTSSEASSLMKRRQNWRRRRAPRQRLRSARGSGCRTSSG